jgi:hypothetical protein
MRLGLSVEFQPRCARATAYWLYVKVLEQGRRRTRTRMGWILTPLGDELAGETVLRKPTNTAAVTSMKPGGN